eukprot:6213285-Pleurochrysis_carterae.AAC.1
MERGDENSSISLVERSDALRNRHSRMCAPVRSARSISAPLRLASLMTANCRFMRLLRRPRRPKQGDGETNSTSQSEAVEELKEWHVSLWQMHMYIHALHRIM